MPAMSAKWLILGCGYVGRELGRRAIGRGVTVAAVTRNAIQAQALAEDGFAPVVTAELGSSDWHQPVGCEYDAVINCVSGGRRGLEGYRQSYVAGQQSLVAWARQSGVPRAVYTSSTSVYPQVDGETVDENAPTEPATPAGRLLLEAESIFQTSPPPWAQAYILRLTGIYGPGRHYILDQLLQGEMTFAGGGDDILNLIHRDDICSAIERLLDPSLPVVESGIYNLCSGDHPQRRELVCWLAEQLGLAEPIFDPSQSSPRQRRRALADGRVPVRRIVADRFRSAADWSPRYPDFRSGYRDILAAIQQ